MHFSDGAGQVSSRASKAREVDTAGGAVDLGQGARESALDLAENGVEVNGTGSGTLNLTDKARDGASEAGENAGQGVEQATNKASDGAQVRKLTLLCNGAVHVGDVTLNSLKGVVGVGIYVFISTKSIMGGWSAAYC